MTSCLRNEKRGLVVPRQGRLDTPGTLHHVIVEEVDIKALKAWSRRRKISNVMGRLIEKLVNEFGWSLAETGRQLGLSSSAVSKTVIGKNDKNS